MLKLLTATAATALLLAAPASAQVFGDEYGTDLDATRFNEGFGSTGYYEALDSDRDTFLSENEFSTGLYADYDRDNDNLISTDEYETGVSRTFGDSYAGGAFTDYDSDANGFLNQNEFRTAYEGAGYRDVYGSYDADGDARLTRDEYATGLYNRADANRDTVVSIEEEGLFEGWFDGDDVEAEIEQVGTVY